MCCFPFLFLANRQARQSTHRAPAETPVEWCDILKIAREKPMPFNVVPVTIEHFFGFTAFLKPFYKAANPIATRPVREIHIDSSCPDLIKHRNSWNGQLESAVVIKPRLNENSRRHSFAALKHAYTKPVDISAAKFADLQVLKKFCSVKNRSYFDTLIHANRDSDGEISE